MKLSQLTESFVISNDEFEDYLNRTTEQLAQELQAGKNARDAIHDLALQFAAQHNKAYEAYVRMSDALTARMHTLELDAPAAPSPADTMNEPMADMGDEMGGAPEMMTDPMGDMEMDTPADDEMPSDGDMEDYAAVMDNKPETEEMGESVVKEASSETKPFMKKIIKKNQQATKTETGERFAIINDKNEIEVYSRESDRLIRKVKMPDKESAIRRLKSALYKPDLGTFRGKQMWYSNKKPGLRFSEIDKELEEVSNYIPNEETDDTRMGTITVKTDAERKKRAQMYRDKKAKEVTEASNDTYAMISYNYSDDSCDCKKVNEAEEKPYVCVHAKKGKHECRASTSYEAAKKAAAHWKMKSTAGIDAHLAVDESAQWCGICGNDTCTCPPDAVSESMEVINQIVADKQAGKLHGMTVDMFTASAIKQIYDAVNDDNKAKLDELMSSKEGVLKAANIAMKMMKEGVNEEQLDEFVPALAAAGAAARAIGGAALRAAPKVIKTVGNIAGAASTAAGAVKKGINKVKGLVNNEAESKADSIMRTSTRASFSEYNEFYKELDKAAKAGKKAGDTITVGGKNIKLKSNPKQMHQLTDSDMNAIDALAEKCKSHRK